MSLLKDKLLQNFNAEYNKLNAQQKQAVDKIYGPVMVVAGPGTGKTQILSVRIGKILLETDVLPSNILCLTYTDAGVLAMRKRLLSLIGPDAYTVQIHSFHSFCNMVIQQNMHLFHKKDLQPINELEQVQCLVELIDSFDNTNPLKRFKTDAYFEANYLKELFGSMKREGWTPEFLLQKIDDYVENIIPETFYNKTKFKKGIVELTVEGKKEIEKMVMLKAAVQAFPQYQQILKEKQRYDFDDMINWVIAVFESDPEVLASYQEQYQFFLVDEYQDTSGAQNKLVELLVSYWQEESPNLFVVGDDDQSIYRFQGANMENMVQLARKYEKDLLQVVLTQNYRSVQPILDAAHSLIQNNVQRLVNEYKDLEKILTSANEAHKDLQIAPVIRSVNNEFEENILIAEEIRELIAEGVEPGRIAVIYKEHKTGEELQKFLQLQSIPYYTRKSLNLLKEPLVKKILSYPQYIIAEKEIPFSGESVLFEILHHNFHHLPALKIATICNEVNTNKRTKKEPVFLRDYLGRLTTANQQKLFSDDETTDRFIRVHQVLEQLISASENLPLLKWFELLFNEAGILSYIMKQPDKAWLMKLLNGFFDFLQDECRRNPDMDLEGLLKQIHLLEENGISIPLVQTSGNEKGVNLLTCHGSKGLEYEYVFFIGCYSSVWETKRKFSQGYKLPPNVFNSESPEEKEEELRRLFFVAATRAEKYLYISFPSFTNEGKALEASRFIAEMNSLDLKVQPITINEDTRLVYSSLRYGLVQQPELEKAEKDFIDNLLVNFKMNVTALNNYLECPIKFYYNNLIRIPSAISESAQFGSSMHDALNFFYVKMMEAGRQYPGKEVLINRFQWHIHFNREVFTKESLLRFTEYGSRCLSAFYDQFFAGAGEEFVRTEVPMEAVVDHVPLKGFADKLQYWGNEVMITDFKTGSLEKSNRRYEFVEPGHPQKPEGGNYWRQAVFYKILFDRQKAKNKELRGIEFLFIEPNEKNEFDHKKIIIRPDHEEIVLDQVQQSWERIQAHDFYKGCGKPECHWCNFVKEHKLYVSLHELKEEEELTEFRVM
ncbi:ATP-dependent helicase [Flavisolibacter ginsengisoli]|jgi:DNA helicase-2/ATP-dependent DNA helicase PcrA|uniref:DNA 3'-5' helicase n=1 Tax=Flavisolibacter ginsengisoli DSM 18119 TaxID=1121884 RepID=A0A1M5E594_9BACT|nr:ATP-dependent DNA helicase [Flavisolibacter ginsengisoli]SHF74419.1 DNA helicase-2 / ATP-dependent DNA helicase PcrA [Flavisolibacter ginsengisoli DSM 18119]